MTVTRYPLIDGVTRCLDPGALYSDSTAAPQDFWGKANSITCPTGQTAGAAYFVVTRAVNDSLAMNSLHTIDWLHENGTTTWQQYVISRIWMVGIDGDGLSAALVEMRDKRHLMRGAANWQYNVRRHSVGTYSSGNPAGQYYTDSLNAGSLWTWQAILNDMWLNFPK
jgi:hypothetical protein